MDYISKQENSIRGSVCNNCPFLPYLDNFVTEFGSKSNQYLNNY